MIYTVTANPAVDRELTVPALEFDTVLRANHTRTDPGGKGFNVSRLLKGMGVDSIATGFLGGKAGEMLQESLKAQGIGTEFVWLSGETRTNISIVTESGGHYIKVNEPGPLVDDTHQKALLDRIDGLAKPGDWWVLAGSLPPGVAADFYARILRVLNHRGANSLVDTSGESLRMACAEHPYLIKPNCEEIMALTGLPASTPAEIAAAAAEMRRMGAHNVIVSMGKAGALLHTGDEVWLAHSPEIEEKNPIGAGDSMVGGLLAALTQGMALKDALCWGTASGAATASLSGTEVGSRALIESLLERVSLEQLKAV
jgi:1-phosphofructokinase family hexose kinase